TGDSDDGIEAGVAAINQKSTASKAMPAAGAEASGEVVAKHDHGDTTIQTFTRDDGRRIDLQKGFVNLFPVELVRCELAFNLWEALLPAAWAHGGAGSTDVSIIDVSQADGTGFALGELSATPGRYCGLRVALVPVASATAAPDEVDMSGSSLYVAPCYFYDDADPTKHYCFTLSVAGGSDELLLDFASPLELDADHRHAELTVAVTYDGWFNGLDLEGYPAAGTAEEKTAFKAGLQANEALKAQLRANVLEGLTARVE
ncbi:MAG: hypothetical protein ACREE7_08650, partial [Dongiaceae bacterium]